MKRKGCWIALGLVGAAFIGLLLSGPGQAFLDIWRTGAIQGSLSNDERTYSATSEENLKALHTALMLYHDSEGQFPSADGWMDAILPRLRTDDLKKGEEKKKLTRPENVGTEGRYGYVLNEAASGKYKDELDPKAPLVYQSTTNSGWNAHGEQKQDGVGSFVTVDGSLVRVP